MNIPTDSPIPDKALWRYGVISPLLHRDPNGLTRTGNALERGSRRRPHGSGPAVARSLC